MEEKFVLVFSHSELSLMLTALDRLREDTKVERYQVQALHLGDAIQEILEPGTFDSFHPAKLAARAHRLVIPALLEQPRPEAREEDIEIIRKAIELILGQVNGSLLSRSALRGFANTALAALSRLTAKEGQSQAQQARIENLRESLVIADARMTKQLSGKLMSVTLIGYLNQIQQDIRAAIKADNEAAAPGQSAGEKT